MRNTLIKQTSSVLLALLLSSAPAVAQEPGVFKIGFVIPLSGPATGAMTTSGQQGLALAVSEINSANLAGRKFEVIVADEASDPRTASEVCNRLILSDKVNVIVTQGQTSTRVACNQAALKAGIPHLVASISSPDICFPNMFSTSSEIQQLYSQAVRWLIENGHKRIYFVGHNYSGPRDGYANTKKILASMGGQDVGNSFLEITTQDFSNEISKIAAAKPDAILLALVGPGAITFHRQFGADPRVGSVKRAEVVVTHDTLRGLSKSQSELFVAATYFSEIESPANNQFKAALSKMYGEKALPDNYSAGAYSTALLLAKAVSVAGTSPSALMAALPGKSVDGPQGKTTQVGNFSSLPIYFGAVTPGKINVLSVRNDVAPAPACR